MIDPATTNPEDFRYRVTARVRGGLRLDAVTTSLENASRLWIQFRNGHQFGASDQTSVVKVIDYDLFKDNGKEVARISYNGAVWPPGPWRNDKAHSKPLLPPQEGNEHDCWDQAVHDYDPGSMLGDAYYCGRCQTLLQVG